MTERPLPMSSDAERFVLGSILLNDAHYLAAASELTADDFGLERNRRIFRRMADIRERGETIERVSLANELARFRELEDVGGLGYLLSLDDGLPATPNIDGYVRIVKDKSTLRALIYAGESMMNRALLQEESPAAIIGDTNRTLLQMGETRGSPQTFGATVLNYPGGIEAFLNPSKRARGVPTGFARFDEMTGGGLHPGELCIIAARPSMGKTALALNIAGHVAVRQRRPVVIFSLEMSRELLLTRMLCAAARVDSQKFRAGYLNADERRKISDALHELVDAPIHVDDEGAATVMQIHSKTQRLIAENGPMGLVVVDYLQLMSGRGENRTQEVSGLSRGLKLLSKELNVPVMALSQLSRAPDQRQGDHRPQLSDLRESGSIEQDADVVAFIFREEVYNRDREDLRGLAELILAKQRNGPVGAVNLVFLHAQTKFETRCEDAGDAD